MSRKIVMTEAIISLAPGAMWSMTGDDLDTLVWLSDDIARPSNEELKQEVDRLQAEYDALEYQRLRALEYPDFRDYLDGVVKNDQVQIDAYIAACLAVKEKYPKPSES